MQKARHVLVIDDLLKPSSTKGPISFWLKKIHLHKGLRIDLIPEEVYTRSTLQSLFPGKPLSRVLIWSKSPWGIALMLDNLHKIRTGLSLLAVAFLIFTVGALRVSADTTTITINVPNSGLGTDMGPYARVTINLASFNSNTATVTVDSLTNGGYLYRLGNAAVELNVNGAHSTFNSATVAELGTTGGFTPTYSSVSNPAMGDGFGSFTFGLNNVNGFRDSATEISFTLTKASGTWSSASNVLTPNATHNSVAVDLFACATTCTFAEGATNGGFAGVSPEPASMLLFGTGLLTFMGIIRRRRLKLRRA